MSALTPDASIASFLADELSLDLGTTIFVGPVRPPTGAVPDAAIFCLATGGAKPEAGFQGHARFDDVKPVVQVWVRSEPNDYDGGIEQARAVHEALHRAAIDGYASCRALQSHPVYLEMDGDGHHEFVLMFELWASA